MVLRVMRISEDCAPGEVEYAMGLLAPDLVLGPEWARGLAVGKLFVPLGKRAEWYVAAIKREFMRKYGVTAKFDEVKI